MPINRVGVVVAATLRRGEGTDFLDACWRRHRRSTGVGETTIDNRRRSVKRSNVVRWLANSEERFGVVYVATAGFRYELRAEPDPFVAKLEVTAIDRDPVPAHQVAPPRNAQVVILKHQKSPRCRPDVAGCGSGNRPTR